ncbi:MAG: ANTAR domain-containing protein with unknown sensor, uroporphyrinogen-III synthase [Candidatus Gottesmanbacteria bacterium GW2011_GWA2_43_14]|uniref:ANTAR domain-containing protein n=1 Tax=Candidatus Gottesmanbacteria bacterium GW2011_GWA2_43_14 TaxID=1618443 RepID=A0A0G1FU38_9BACT|nr:MAG: ANTAR domain-containing protein with unknown sensor, uroporphyrinogen-III synthase [Candidatus Gottesmanbacteria bacterium GW2011_GWA2_43_14]
MKKEDKVSELKKELSFLYKITQDLHKLEISELLQEIVKIADQVTRADSCLIYVLDQEKNELVLRASKNPHSHLLKKIKMKMGEGITGWVAKEKKPVAIGSGASKDTRFKYFRNLPEDKFEAFLSVPVLNKKGVCGVINVQHKKAHKHTATEINLLSAIGKLAGTAVENALLIEESLSLRETLEMRKVLDKAKGILMKNNRINENEAYRRLRQESMNSRKSIGEIAEAIILAERMKLGA